MKIKTNKLDFIIESDLEAIRSERLAKSIMVKGKINWEDSIVKMWVNDRLGISENFTLLMVSTVLPQRLLLASVKWWRYKCKTKEI